MTSANICKNAEYFLGIFLTLQGLGEGRPTDSPATKSVITF